MSTSGSAGRVETACNLVQEVYVLGELGNDVGYRS
jgi:hypothetical protein